MILGLTHDENGVDLQRLAVSHKVSIGLAPDEHRNHPGKLDHFEFRHKSVGEGGTLVWEKDADLTKHYGESCREFWVVVHSDKISDVFRTELAWWGQGGKKCWGDGLNATRRTERNPDGEPYKPCGKECKDLDEGRCNASGDLYFFPLDFPRLGSVWKLHTGGKRSIGQVYSSLSQFQSIFGRLAGLRVKLCVRPEKTSYSDAQGKRKSTTIYAVSLELDAQDVPKMLETGSAPALLFDQTRRMLTAKVEYEVEEDTEEAAAPTLTAEFYPENRQEEPAPKPVEPDADAEQLFKALRYNQAQRMNAIGQSKTLEELKAKLGVALKAWATPTIEPAEGQGTLGDSQKGKQPQPTSKPAKQEKAEPGAFDW